MTRLTRPLKSAPVRIQMTVETTLERNAFETYDRRVRGSRRMASGTRYINVTAGEAESRLVMRESRDGFPSFCRMARPALRCELSAMRIVMTCHALRTESEIRTLTQERVICADIRRLNKLRLVTLCAFQVRMFPVKGEPRRAIVVVP
jgi:hypothetical protein